MFSLEHIHPMVVHFPIALLIVGFMSELVYLFFRKDPLFSFAGFWLLCAGALGAAAAYASGVFLTSEIYGAAGAIQYKHEQFAEISTISSLVSVAFKIYLKSEGKEESPLKWIAFSLFAFTVITVSITGYYGGVLVYEYLMK